ncbi:asparagine synthase (glutamine-hydrolyzing) [Micromonospora sp. NPDC050187]|uniref:asparagine synthase (glutamine-hydrolyzing) n=1 Tax=Micromonospora sp. NPDC050187 TaxID=3364277 RepID=UPI0037A4E5A2
MSGIAGWVDYERDLSRAQATVRAMSATMANRGPDAEGIWTSPRAAIGHRRLALVDLDGGRQPYVVEADGQVLAVVAVDGDVYNAPALRAELESHGHRFRSRGDAEVVAYAYLQWGAGLAEKLEGGYAFAVWDVRREELLLVRDRLGARPLFYYPTPHGTLFASERKAILDHPQAEAVLDADGLREILSYAGTPGHGVFKGMHQVRAGHVVRVTRSGHREERYWALEAQPHTDDLDTTVSTVRELLEQSVSGQLTADVPLGMMLSGGLDSSAVTALAARALAKRGDGPLHTFTVSFGEVEEFNPDEVWGSSDAPYVKELVDAIGAEHTDIVLDTADLLDPIVAANALRAKDVPSPLGNMNTSLYVLCRAVQERTPLALLGDAADGIFGGAMWLSMPPLMEAQTFPWIAMAHWGGGKHGMGTDLIDAGLLDRLDMRGYTGGRYREAMDRVPLMPGETGQEKRMREMWYLGVTNWLETLLPHSEAIAGSVGLSLRLPYLDHRLVQYVYSAPWSQKSFDGREKSLLRAAVQDVLPPAIVDRKKSPYPVTQDAAYGKALCDQLLALTADRDAPIAGLVDVTAAKAFAADPESLVSGPRAWVARTHVEMLFQLNMWLDQYRVRVDL